MATYYIDYVNGSDAYAGDSFAAGHPWKTLTLGATAARIAPGDIIKIAKSPAPVALAGTTATWTNLSKTVTLATAETLNVAMCEVDWTAVNATSSAKIGTDWKEGTYALKMVEDATPAADEVQAYFATGTLAAATIGAYQLISFWIKNEVAILANQLELNLCSGTDGTGPLDVIPIPAIPSTGYWVCLTIARNGGTNLGNNGATDVKSINISNGSNATPYTAGKYVYVDNIIATKTAGLNLQSLISKNSAEQGGAEGWYGIQSINGTTVLLDNNTNCKANVGRGYFGATGSVPTYIRETIKTDMASGVTTVVQSIMDSGTYGNEIQYQGGYDTGTGNQTGETYFDGLNGNGYGIDHSGVTFNILNNLDVVRYWSGIHYVSQANNNAITSISNANNCTAYGIDVSAGNNLIIGTILNANNNSTAGISCGINTIIGSIVTNNNNSQGVGMGAGNQVKITTLSSNNNAYDGVGFNGSNKYIETLTTASNGSDSISPGNGYYYIGTATISEGTQFGPGAVFTNRFVAVNKLNGNYAYINTDGGNIVSQASTLTNGSGTEWKFTLTDTANRQLNYPLTLSIAEIACIANKLVTVKCWFKKGHATNIGAKLVFKAQLGAVENIATKANDTNEEELTVTFTPTEAGVAEIEAWAYYVAAYSTVIIDKITVTQAD